MPVRTESQVTGYVHHTQWSQRLAPIRFGRRLRKRIWRQGLLGAVLEAGYHDMYVVKKVKNKWSQSCFERLMPKSLEH